MHAEEMKKESVDPKQIWPYIVLFILCLVTVSGLFKPLVTAGGRCRRYFLERPEAFWTD